MSSSPFDLDQGQRRRDLPPHLTTGPSSSSSSQAQAFPYPDTQLHLPDAVEGDAEEVEDEENIFRDMSFEEILEDLNARFLINLPKEEMSLVRVYWQAEQAHWFYEDYLRPLNPSLPSLSQRNFTRIIIESSPLYAGLLSSGGIDYDKVWEEYCGYKRMVPCCGGILLNTQGDKCLVVRGYKSNAGWSFPRGKINLDESEEACAIREVEEETGFDLTGMVNTADSITTHINAQKVTMFIVLGVDEGTVFETQTRNEIGAIEWVKLNDLPTWSSKRGPKRTAGAGQKKFYNVTPFVLPLKKWLSEHNIDPYARPKKKSHPPSSYRDLQPYQFESPPLQPASPIITRGSSALDHLFARFIHKQEEELVVPGEEAAVGSDNKAGLERLFGNLNVLKAEEQSINDPSQQEKSPEDKEREKKEDDALARLLGAMGGLQTPAPEPPRLAQTQKQSNLLAMLNQRGAQSPTRPQYQQHQQQQRSLGGGQAQQSQSPRQQGSPTKPHQAKLLAMISPPPLPSHHHPQHHQLQSALIHSPSTATSMTAVSGQTPNKPMSLPTSPRPPTPDAGEAERRAKARALLDMTLAGIGLDVPANSVSQLDSFSRTQDYAPHGTAGRAMQLNPSGGQAHGQGGQRITPPNPVTGAGPSHLPPTQPVPPSGYGPHIPTQPGAGQGQGQAYRPLAQPPQHPFNQQQQPRSAGLPGPPPNGNGTSGGPTLLYSSSPTKHHMPQPYDAHQHQHHPQHAMYEARPPPPPHLQMGMGMGMQPRPPIPMPLPPMNAAGASQQSAYRALSQPSQSQPPNAGSMIPGSGTNAGAGPGPIYAQHQFPPNFATQQQYQPAAQGYQPQPQTQALRGPLIPPPNGPGSFPQQAGYQQPPPGLPPGAMQQTLLSQLPGPASSLAGPGGLPPHQHQQQQQQLLAQMQRNSPKSQALAQAQGQQGQVYHPVPRPPANTGAGGLLAMLNNPSAGGRQ